jgi:hypothetical protein
LPILPVVFRSLLSFLRWHRVWNSGTATFSSSTLSGNSGYQGGGVGNAAVAKLTVNNSTLTGNSAAPRPSSASGALRTAC